MCTEPWLTFEIIYKLNFFTAAVHAASALVVFTWSFYMKPTPIRLEDEATGPYLPAVCFKSRLSNEPWFFVEPEVVWQLKEYVAVLITLFFTLSAVFQTFQGINKSEYKYRVESNGTNFLRYIEYSFSASIMMVCIACTLMIFDMYVHILVFTCTFACMMLGLITDCLRTNARLLDKVLRKYPRHKDHDGNCFEEIQETRDGLKELMWQTHYLGWFTLMKPYLFVFAVSYFRTVYRHWACLDLLPEDTPATPPWVHAVVIIQFFLFSCFGMVQLLQLRENRVGLCATITFWEKPPSRHVMSDNEKAQEEKRIGLLTEFTFVVLSLIAKSILGWIVAGNLLFVDVEKVLLTS
jgi:hypothetical protein